MNNIPKATLQINLSPRDFRHAEYILPHQLKQWHSQVEEILITLDMKQSKGRFGKHWEWGMNRINKLIESCVSKYSKINLHEVDYSTSGKQIVSNLFFKEGIIPDKDYRGGPYYSYFYGLYKSKFDYILHIDSDLIFGGGSCLWIKEAIKYINDTPEIVSCSPLPGPPTSHGELFSQSAKKIKGNQNIYRFDFFSTRIFFINRKNFTKQLRELRAKFANGRGIIKGMIEKNGIYEVPEDTITSLMVKNNLFRDDFLGSGKGMWSLHPPYRTEDFYNRLPKLIQIVENGNIPDAQKGYHDINDSLIDWSDARIDLKNNKWWKRLLRKFEVNI